MGDSTNSWDIPQNVDMAAGYINGIYAWNALAWARWIGKPVRRICVDGSDLGDALDVERGDAYPWQAPGWTAAARARGVADPWVYVSLSLWSATRTEFHLRSIPEPQWWIADYDNDPTIPAGAIAKQYANATFTGAHYDLSSVSDAAFGGASQQVGGFLMGLSDAQQADMYEKVQFIYNLLIPGNLQNPPHDLLSQMQAHFATLEAAASALKVQVAAIPTSTGTIHVSGDITGTISGSVSG